MKSFEYTIKDPLGIHARPAGVLVKEVKKYSSTVNLTFKDKTVQATKLMAIMGLGIKTGNTIRIDIEGDDEDAACEGIKNFLEANL